MLFESRGGSKGFAALGTGVAAGPHMIGSNVSLQIGGVGEDFVTILAGESPEFAVYHFVSQEVGAPGEGFGTVFTGVLASIVTMGVNHMFIQPIKKVSF